MKLSLKEQAKILLKNPPPNWMEALWKVYVEAVMPKGAPPVQITECRRAFFSGARALFELQTGVFAEQSDDDAEASMQKVSEELDAFSRSPF